MKTKIGVTILIAIFVIGIAIIGYVSLIPRATAMNKFEAIPDKPNDFDAYTREVWSGGLTDLCEIEDNYWKQPEFYGNSWNIAQDKFYNNPDYSKWGVYGQGNIPKSIGYTFTNLKKGDEFELCSFFHNGFGVWTYQGFKLITEENDYFDIEITPNELTMSPTFPVFEDGWSQKIKIKLIAKQNVPAGDYKINLIASEPSQEYAREETKRILKLEINKEDYYKECVRFLKDEERCNKLINLREKKYVNGGSYQSSEPLLALNINIK